jgi:glycerol kinase
MHTILAIDQGTHASRALLFDRHGNTIASAHRAIGLIRKDSNRVEQDADEILASVREVIEAVLPAAAAAVSSAALATQRSTLVAWDKQSGEPLAPAISWQDRRAGPALQAFQGQALRIRKITGLPLSPHYLAGKITWLLQHDKAVSNALHQHTLCIGPLASFLCFRLLKGRPGIVDHSNAARSLLFDLRTLDWSPELLDLFAIPRSILPDCHPTLYAYGMLEDYGIPLHCLCGDQNAAIHAGGIPAADTALVNTGSGAFVLQSRGPQVPEHPRLLCGIAHSTASSVHYLVEGTVNGAGSVLDALAGAELSPDYHKQLPQWLAVIKNPPVYLNGTRGLGSPWWVEQLASRFIPDTADFACRAVAVIESIVFLLWDNLQQLDLDVIGKIRISGGLSNIDGLCQRLADLSGMPVWRGADHETTARGAAWLVANRNDPWQQETAPICFEPCHAPALLRRYRSCIHEMIRTLGQQAAWYPLFKRNEQRKKLLQIIAHRGFSKRFPENTLAAVREAIKAGCHGVEFDIQFSRDGQPMLLHDAALVRTTGRPGQVFDFSCAELQTMQTHVTIPSGETCIDCTIPSLDELIALMVQHRRIIFFAEVKRQTLEYFGMEQVMNRLLRDLQAHAPQCVIISFDRTCLEYVRHESDMAIGWVLRHFDDQHHEQAAQLQPDYLICNYEKIPLQQVLWDGTWDWMVYEINSPAVADDYHNRGVRYISTADVQALVAGTAQRSHMRQQFTNP